MAEQTENERIAGQCGSGSGGGGRVDTAVDVVDRRIGEYECNVSGKVSMPTRAQAPSTVNPFGNLRGG